MLETGPLNTIIHEAPILGDFQWYPRTWCSRKPPNLQTLQSPRDPPSGLGSDKVAEVASRGDAGIDPSCAVGSGGVCYIPDTPWDCHICRPIDPSNHPNVSIYMAYMECLGIGVLVSSHVYEPNRLDPARIGASPLVAQKVRQQRKRSMFSITWIFFGGNGAGSVT